MTADNYYNPEPNMYDVMMAREELFATIEPDSQLWLSPEYVELIKEYQRSEDVRR